jgi:hypothetical protein
MQLYTPEKYLYHQYDMNNFADLHRRNILGTLTSASPIRLRCLKRNPQISHAVGLWKGKSLTIELTDFNNYLKILSLL